MKKFTPLIILFFTLLYLHSEKVKAQGAPLETDCFYQSGDECISIGYQSVTERLNEPNRLDVEVIFRATCENIAEIRVNPIIGDPVIATGVDITGENQTVAFIVNANAFDNDNTLRFTIVFTDGTRTEVDIFFSEELSCGEIFPLPVELTSFEGKTTESGINLEWETASEINNSHFDVERSSNGKTYQAIATVRGRGTTSTTSNYSLTDKLPQKGLNYYRLKQIDFDNTTSYSKTIAVKWDASETVELALVPNPCRGGDCTIEISNAANLETLVQLKDMTGRVVYSKTVRSDSHLLELPVAELKQYKGLYFLTATTGKQVVHQRILLE